MNNVKLRNVGRAEFSAARHRYRLSNRSLEGSFNNLLLALEDDYPHDLMDLVRSTVLTPPLLEIRSKMGRRFAVEAGRTKGEIVPLP